MRVGHGLFRSRLGLVMFPVAVTVAAVLMVYVAGAGPSSAAERAVVVVLAVVQVGSLALMRDRPERSMAVSLVAGVGLQALWPDLGLLGLATFRCACWRRCGRRASRCGRWA